MWLGRLRHGNRSAELIARADPDAELEFVVEIAGGTEARNGSVAGLRWPFGRRTPAPDGLIDEARP